MPDKWTQEKRDAHPKHLFGDPEKQAFPVSDQEDLDNANHDINRIEAGRRKGIAEHLKKIATELKLTLPEGIKKILGEGDAEMALGDMSDGEVEQAVQKALSAAHPLGSYGDRPYIRHVYSAKKEVVFQIGSKTWHQQYDISDKGLVTLKGNPTEVTKIEKFEPVAKMSGEPGSVQFASLADAKITQDGDDLVYEGTLLTVGDYRDKGLVVNPEDIAYLSKIREGQTIPLAHMHDKRSPFYKTLHRKDDAGNYRYGLVSRQDHGDKLTGSVRVPKWVKDAVGDEEFAVSLYLPLRGTAPIDLTHIGIVDEGRCPEAIVKQKFAAAFSAHCEMASARHSKADMDMFQGIHDHAVELGADCGAALAGARHSMSDKRDIQDMHDLAVKHGAECKPTEAPLSARNVAPKAGKEKSMETSKWKTFLTWLKSRKPEELEAVGLSADDPGHIEQLAQKHEADEAAALAATQKAEADKKAADEAAAAALAAKGEPELPEAVKTHMTEMNKLRDELAAERAMNGQKSIDHAAELFAATYTAPNGKGEVRVPPKDKEIMKDFYRGALIADGKNGAAAMSASNEPVEGEYVKKLRAYYDGLQPIPEYQASLIPDAAMADGDQRRDLTDAEIAGMMRTPLGRASSLQAAESKNGTVTMTQDQLGQLVAGLQGKGSKN